MKRLFAVLLAVLMLAAIAMPVFANSDAETEEVLSPTEKAKYKIDIYYDLDTVVYDGQVLVPAGDDYVFIPKEQDPKYVFDHIEIEGDYTMIQDGDKYIITPKGDLVIHVKYKGQNPAPTPSDTGKESPNTGLQKSSGLPAAVLVLIAVIAVAGVVLSVRKLRKN